MQKFWFIKPPKTASLSIRTALQPVVGYRSGVWLGDGHLLNRKDDHYSIDQAIQMLNNHRVDPKEVWFFSFVRNPFDRMVSFWLWTYRNKKRPLNPLDVWIDTYVKNQRRKQLPLTCTDFVFGVDGWRVDYIGRFEQLAHDVQAVAEKLGIPTLAKLPHRYKSRGRLPYQHYYEQAPAARALIEEHFVEDLKAFDYRYESR